MWLFCKFSAYFLWSYFHHNTWRCFDIIYLQFLWNTRNTSGNSILNWHLSYTFKHTQKALCLIVLRQQNLCSFSFQFIGFFLFTIPVFFCVDGKTCLPSMYILQTAGLQKTVGQNKSNKHSLNKMQSRWQISATLVYTVVCVLLCQGRKSQRKKE